jgi:hypothetical protein
LGRRDEGSEWVSRETAPGVVLTVCEGRSGPIPQYSILVRLREVRGRGHCGRGGEINNLSEWWISRKSRRWACIVGCVCWRHTTTSDGTWVWFLLAADMNVRTLGWARCGAPNPWRGVFVSDVELCGVAVLWVGIQCVFEVGGAGFVGGGHNSNFE